VIAKATPTISRNPTASTITYGQTLAAASLINGAANVSGAFAFAVPSTAPNAGQELQSVVFTPNDSVNYLTTTVSVPVFVQQKTIPAVAFTFTAPSSLAYDGLTKPHSASAAELSGTIYLMVYSYSGVSGTIYGPSSTAPTNVGSYAVTATLYSSNFVGSATKSFAITKASVASSDITFTPPGNLTYNGTAKGFTATATGISGFTYSYSGRDGTSYGPSSTAPTYAGSYTVTATVNDPLYMGTKSLDFVIAKIVPTINTNPITHPVLTYGQALSATNLFSGVASVPGTFAFSNPSTVLNAGTFWQSVVFTPTDTVNYTTATGSALVYVEARVVSAGAFTFTTPSSFIYDGSPKVYSATAAGPAGTISAMSYSYVGINGTVYGPSATAPTNAGSYSVTANIIGTNIIGSATQIFAITKVVPVITWATPASIPYYTALSATQLNATANMAGNFTYTPALGTVLEVGSRSLQAVFTPTDTVNYATVTTSVPLQVTSPQLPIALLSPPNPTYDGTPKAYVASQNAYLSAGNDHAIALRSDGTVVAWGYNAAGQCNVVGLSNVVQVTAGYSFSAAVKANGTVVPIGNPTGVISTFDNLNTITNATAAAAGGNFLAVLRNNGTVQCFGWIYNTSTLTIPTGLSEVTAIASGYDHVLALKSNGTVVAWGNNGNGQCNVPAGLSNVVAVAANGNYSLALKADGTVVAWGSNSMGQCDVPAGLSGVISITAGYSTGYAIKADGTVVGWGYNFGYNMYRFVPSDVTGVVALAVGEQHAVAIKNDGTVVAWGRIPNNDRSDSFDASTFLPNPLVGVGNFTFSYSYSGRAGTTYAASSTAPTNAGNYTLAISSTLTNYSYGKTVDFTIAKATPTITFIPQLSIITQGQALSAITLNGGEASVPGTFSFTTPSFVPDAGATIQEITFTPTDTVNYAIVKLPVTVRSQGSAAVVPTILTQPTAAQISYGQRLQASTLSGGVASVPGTFVYSSALAIPNPGTARQSVTFIPTDIVSYAAVTMFVPLTVVDGIISPLNISLIPPASLVYDGAPKGFSMARGSLLSSNRLDYLLVVKSDGTVGDYNNVYNTPLPAGLTGVVAVSARSSSYRALYSNGTVTEWGLASWEATVPDSAKSGVVAITSGWSHSLALKSNGTVIAWGQNYSGECNVPAGLTNVVAIAANYSASFALKSNGTVVAWGSNDYGQCNVPAGLSGVIAISAGKNGTIAALKSDGTVVSWGNNVTGQNSVPAGLTNVVAVAVGTLHTAALKSDGTVVTWGLGTTLADTNRTNFVPYNLTGVVALSASYNRTYALRSDGSVVWWGQAGNSDVHYVDGSVYLLNGSPVSVPAITPILPAGSAGFSFSTTYTGRDGTTYTPTSTPPTNPGDYSVTVTGTDPDFVATKTIDFSIAKATPIITGAPTAAGINYGQSLASATLSGGAANVAGTFTFATPDVIPNAGTNMRTVVFNPTDTTKYQPVEIGVSVIVNRATASLVTLPTATTITYGQTLAASILANGLTTVPGVFAFTNPSTTPIAGTGIQEISFTPTDTGNFNGFTANVSLMIAKANPTITVNPTASTINYGQALATSTLSGGSASVPGSFSFEDGTVIPIAGSSSQNVIFTPTDTANFNPTQATVTVFARSFATANDSGLAGEAGGVANAIPGFEANGNVISNDINYEGSSLAISAIRNSGGFGTVGSAFVGTYGSLTIQANGDYVYSVANNNSTIEALQQNGSLTESFTYSVTNGTFTDTGILLVTIQGANDAPIFSNLSGGTVKQGVEDTETAITLADIQARGNATDIDGTVDSYLVTAVSNGSLRIGSNSSTALPWDSSNSVIDATHNAYWSPDSNTNGLISAFSLVARDDLGLVSVTPVVFQVQVQAVNDTPVANDQFITTDEDTTYIGTLTGSDVENSALTYTIVTVPTKGTVIITNVNTGAFTYTPNLNATGLDSFTINVNDGSMDSVPATISVNIGAVNDVPVANAQSITPTEDTLYNGTLTGSDVEGSALGYYVVSQGTKGVVTITNTATGAFTYLPNADANGVDSFTFKVDDGSLDSDPAIVTVNITPANDTPTLQTPTEIIVTDTSATDSFTASSGSLVAADVDANTTLTFSIVNGTVDGIVATRVGTYGTLVLTTTTGAYTFTPNDAAINALIANTFETFTFGVFDGVATTHADLVINLVAANDTPILQTPTEIIITDTSSADSFAASSGSLVAADVDANTTLTYSIVGITAVSGVATKVGTYGTLVLTTTTGAYTFTPNDAVINPLTANTTETFTLGVSDGVVTTNVDLVVNISAVNDVPVANAQSITPIEDTIYNGTLTGSDVENSALTYTIVTAPTKGVVVITDATTGAFTYTPNLNATGSDSFAFTVSDGSLVSTPATISVNINAVNDVPVANAQSITPTEDTLYNGTLTGLDVENSALTYTIVTAPTKGVVVIIDTATGAFTYTPNLNATGSDSFAFTVSDGSLVSTPATISVNISAVNDVPVANAQSITPIEDTIYNGTLTGSDVENSTLTYTIVTAPTKGVVVITDATTGAFTYTPNLNATGSDSFTFKVNDGTIDSAPATISVNITAVNDTPSANAQTISPTEDITYTGTLTASDIEGSTLTYSIVTTPSKGTVTITNTTTGAFTYVPNLNATGADSFTFKVNDGTVDSAPATITVNILATQDVPVIAPIATVVYTNTNATDTFANNTGTIAASDVDENTVLTYGISGLNVVLSNGLATLAGQYGTVVVNTLTGAYTYTPNQSAVDQLSGNASEQFMFTVSDGISSVTTSYLVNLVDLERPSISLTSSVAEVGINQTAAITFVFSEVPVGFSASAISVTNGTISSLLVSGNPKIYNAVFTPSSGVSGVATITVNGVYTDAAGNFGTSGTLSPSIEVNTLQAPLMPTTSPAPGSGGSSTVSLVDPNTGEIVGTMVPFEGFTGEIRTVAGDINGDGKMDMVVAPGAGGGPAIMVMDPETGDVTQSFFAFDPAFAGGVYITLSDVNNDGSMDIIAGAGKGGGPHVKIFDGSTGRVLKSFFAYAEEFRGGVSVASVDINQDGILDLITGAGPGGAPHVKVYNGANGNLISEWFAYPIDFTGGVYVAAGDIGNTGRFVVVTGAGSGGAPVVAVWDPLDGMLIAQFMAYDSIFTGGVRVGVSDGNFDGVLDLITGPGPGGAPQVKGFGFPTLDLLFSFFSGDPTNTGGVFVS
jgi:VCBS repeat-containing protein